MGMNFGSSVSKTCKPCITSEGKFVFIWQGQRHFGNANLLLIWYTSNVVGLARTSAHSLTKLFWREVCWTRNVNFMKFPPYKNARGKSSGTSCDILWVHRKKFAIDVIWFCHTLWHWKGARLFRIPSFKTKTNGQRSFSFPSATVWNNLPQTVRYSISISPFKSSLKTHLFSK